MLEDIEKKGFVVAIDGPAASGKSTTAQLLAQYFGMMYVDTGAMYRVVALAVLENGIRLDGADVLENFLKSIKIEHTWRESIFRIFLNSRDVTNEIRSPGVTEIVSDVARIPIVRKHLARLQRELGSKGDVIMEGRDIGTVVFPDADLKIFLTANLETRTKRRKKDMQQILAVSEDFDEQKRRIEKRDAIDSQRMMSPLKPAADAILLDTTNLSVTRQVELIRTEIEKKLVV